MRYPPYVPPDPSEVRRPAPGPIPGLEFVLRFFALLDNGDALETYCNRMLSS